MTERFFPFLLLLFEFHYTFSPKKSTHCYFNCDTREAFKGHYEWNTAHSGMGNQGKGKKGKINSCNQWLNAFDEQPKTIETILHLGSSSCFCEQ